MYLLYLLYISNIHTRFNSIPRLQSYGKKTKNKEKVFPINMNLANLNDFKHPKAIINIFLLTEAYTNSVL